MACPGPRDEKRASTVWRKAYPDTECTAACSNAVWRKGVPRCRNANIRTFDDELDARWKIGKCRGFMLKPELLKTMTPPNLPSEAPYSASD